MLPPGPATHPVVQIARWVFSPLPFLRQCAAEYGDIFTLRAAGFGPIVVVTSPSAVREVFTGDTDVLHAGPAKKVLAPTLGKHSLILLDGPAHARHRKLIVPPLHGERMRLHGESMRLVVDQAIDAWPVGREFTIYESMQRISLEVIYRVVFGFQSDERSPDLEEALLDATARPAPILFFPKLHFKRFGPYKRLIDRIRKVDAALYERIAQRRLAPDLAQRHDILSLLLQTRDERGESLTDAEIRDELITMLIAGYETTAATLGWALYLILGHPCVYSRLLDELRRVMGESGLQLDKLDSLLYLDATIKEVLRLYPVLPSVARILTAPMKVDKYDLPVGAIVMPCSWLTHRRPDLYHDPDSFRPERFLSTKANAYEYYPFGGGARRCVGMALAQYESRLVLAQTLLRADLRLVPGYTARVERRSTILAPRGGTRVLLDESPRVSGSSAPATARPEPATTSRVACPYATEVSGA